jgi:cyclase
MKQLFGVTLVLITCFLTQPAWACSPAEPLEHSATWTRFSGVGSLVGYSSPMQGNVLVSSGPDGVLLIDAGDTNPGLALRQEIQKNWPQQPIKYLVNTHWHPDHTGGNRSFTDGTTIIAHKNGLNRLSSTQYIEYFQRTFAPLPVAARPTVTFEQSYEMTFNGEKIELVYFPNAHTDSDIAVFFRGNKVVHLGDMLISEYGFAFVDLSTGGYFSALSRALESILARVTDDYKVVTGHGKVISVAVLREQLVALRETLSIVARGIKAGKSLKQLQSEGLPSKYNSWSSALIPTANYIGLLYRDPEIMQWSEEQQIDNAKQKTSQIRVECSELQVDPEGVQQKIVAKTNAAADHLEVSVCPVSDGQSQACNATSYPIVASQAMFPVSSIEAMLDLRPRDGVLSKLALSISVEAVRAADGRHPADLTISSTFFDRATGKEVSSTKKYDLACTVQDNT